MSNEDLNHDDRFAKLLAENVEAIRAELCTGGSDVSVGNRDTELMRARECLELLEQLRNHGDPLVAGETPQGGTTGGHGGKVVTEISQLGRFQIVRELGHGGLGVVYLASDPQVRRQVALKVPRPEVLASADLRLRFVREAEAAARLSHRNLVPVYEAGEVGPICYIASEYCPGPTLCDWLQQFSQGVSIDEAARITMQLALGVQHAHGRGVLHRDIKPSNVLLVDVADDPMSKDRAGCPMLTDFGMAKLLEAEGGATRSGALVGTPAYMAPEQAQGRVAELDARTDVYALGAILYELLTGRSPHRGDSDVEILHSVLFDEPTGPRKLRASIPRDLEAITLRCLAKLPDERYATAQQLADDLARFRAGELTEARPLGAPGKLWKWVKRNPLVASLATCAVVALVLGTVASTWFAISSQQNAQLARQNSALAEQRAADALASTAEAVRQKDIAQQQEQAARGMLYASNIQLVRPAWERADVARITELLGQVEPKGNEKDIRGWEWYYWRRQCNSDLRTLTGHPAWVQGVAFHPDASRVASVSVEGMLRIWNAHTGEITLEINEKDGGFYNVAYSPDGRTFASSGENSTIKIRDAATGEVVSTLPGSKSYPQRLAFSPDGKCLAATNGDRTVKLIDVASAKILHSIPSPSRSSPIVDVAFSADGRLLATVVPEGQVHLWNTESGESVRSFADPSNRLHAVAFSPDGRLLAAGGYAIKLWKVGDWTELGQLVGHTERINCLAFSRDGRRLASAGDDRAIKLWDVEKQAPLGSFAGHVSQVNSVAFSSDGMLASASNDKTFKLWDLDAGVDFRLLRAKLPRDGHSIAFSPDGTILATGAYNGPITIRYAETGEQLLVLLGHTNWVRSLEFSSDGRHLLSASNDETTRIWDVQAGKLAHTLASGVSMAHFSPDGRHVLTAGDAIQLWDVESGTVLGTAIERTTAVEFFSDNQVIAGTLGGAVTIWDIVKGQRLKQIASGPAIHCLSVSPDRRQLAVGEMYGGMTLWNLESGEQAGSFRAYPSFLNALVYSPDGTRLATLGTPAAIKLWDPARGTEVFSAQFAERAVDLAFHRDGRRIAAAVEGAIVLFDARQWSADEKMGRFLARQITTRYPVREEALAEIERQTNWNEAMRAAASDYARSAALTREQYRTLAVRLMAESPSAGADQLDEIRRRCAIVSGSQPESPMSRRLRAALLLFEQKPQEAIDALGEPDAIAEPIDAALAAVALDRLGNNEAKTKLVARFQNDAHETFASDNPVDQAYQELLGQSGEARYLAKDWQGAIREFELISTFVPLSSQHAEVFANALATQGRWEQSARINRQTAMENKSWVQLYLSAFLHLAANDLPRYRELCRELATKYGQSDTARNYITLTCALGEGGAENMEELLKGAERQTKLRKDDPATLTALGCLRYRAGQLAEARTTLNRSLRLHAIAGLTARDRSGELRLARLTCLTFLAQVDHGLGNAEAARKSIDATEKLIQEMEASGPTPGLIVPWIDRFGVEIARRELARIPPPNSDSGAATPD